MFSYVFSPTPLRPHLPKLPGTTPEARRTPKLEELFMIFATRLWHIARHSNKNYYIQ